MLRAICEPANTTLLRATCEPANTTYRFTKYVHKSHTPVTHVGAPNDTMEALNGRLAQVLLRLCWTVLL
jgi:hypothetical protein